MGEDFSRSVMFGVGRSNQLDTYLSPLEYRGPQFSFLRETNHMTRWADGHISFQQLLEGVFSINESPAKNANDWAGRIGYNAGLHYQWHIHPRLTLMAGGLLGGNAGFLYNDRNGNNPAQGKFNVDLSASAAGIYTFHIRRINFVARYQADLPVFGCMFSPQYGQSYYDISLGHRDHNFVATCPANALSLRQLLTLDIPFRKAALRIGYLSDIRQSHVNHIKTHDISRSFLIGFVKKFALVDFHEKGKRSEKNEP